MRERAIGSVDREPREAAVDQHAVSGWRGAVTTSAVVSFCWTAWLGPAPLESPGNRVRFSHSEGGVCRRAGIQRRR